VRKDVGRPRSAPLLFVQRGGDFAGDHFPESLHQSARFLRSFVRHMRISVDRTFFKRYIIYIIMLYRTVGLGRALDRQGGEK
jgi:hypothetical protein